MLAIDTNVIVRYLTADHPEQAAKAKSLIDGSDIYVCTTVLLETEWVLRSVYGFSSREVAAALRDFAGLPHVALAEPLITAQALAWAEHGMDFADALHLAQAAECEAVVTFDRRFARVANRLGVAKVRVL